MLTFVPLERDHLPQVVDLFNHYILHSTCTFHIASIDLEQMASKAGLGDAKFASFALYDADRFIGYSTLRPWKAQEAYNCTGEVALYLHPESVGRGVGKQALQHLESIAIERGLLSLIAGVCAENDRSLSLFTKSGYNEVGRFPRVGNKFGRELDILYLQKFLR